MHPQLLSTEVFLPVFMFILPQVRTNPGKCQGDRGLTERGAVFCPTEGRVTMVNPSMCYWEIWQHSHKVFLIISQCVGIKHALKSWVLPFSALPPSYTSTGLLQEVCLCWFPKVTRIWSPAEDVKCSRVEKPQFYQELPGLTWLSQLYFLTGKNRSFGNNSLCKPIPGS